jgi:pimeloyl-ACP methyl ester carboxylesterase
MDSATLGLWIVTVVAGFVVGFFVWSALQNIIATRRWFSHPAPPGHVVDIGSIRLYATVKGERSPTIVFDSALGMISATWWDIQDKLSPTMTTVSFDRAGYGWSDPGPSPRTANQVVKELRQLLRRLNLSPPYLLVGHSFGGLTMAYFAKRHPQEVAGLILLDGVPLANARFKEELSPTAFKYGVDKTHMLRLYRILSKLGLGRRLNMAEKLGVPERVQRPLLENYCMGKAYVAMMDENAHIEESISQVRALPEPLAVPVYVVSHSRKVHMDYYAQFGEDCLPWADAKQIEDLWEETYREYLTFSPKSRWFVAEHSSHNIPQDQPQLVISLIRQMLGEIASSK